MTFVNTKCIRAWRSSRETQLVRSTVTPTAWEGAWAAASLTLSHLLTLKWNSRETQWQTTIKSQLKFWAWESMAKCWNVIARTRERNVPSRCVCVYLSWCVVERTSSFNPVLHCAEMRLFFTITYSMSIDYIIWDISNVHSAVDGHSSTESQFSYWAKQDVSGRAWCALTQFPLSDCHVDKGLLCS